MYLGTINELPSRAAAVIRLQEQMALQKPKTVITFAELHRRWEIAEVPTMKNTTANYLSEILRTHVLPVFGNREIASIRREDIQVLLAEQAPKYAKNTLRGDISPNAGAISPDGKMLAYSYQDSDANPQQGIAIMSFDGGPPIKYFSTLTILLLLFGAHQTGTPS